MMRTASLLTTALLMAGMSWSQANVTGYPRKGVLKAGGTLSIGLMTENTQSVFANGYVDFFIDRNISIRGDFYYFIGQIGERPRFDMNHQLFAGPVWNFNTNTGLVPFIGLQPGAALVAGKVLIDPVNYPDEYRILTRKVVPLTSGVAGLTYHAEKWFHLFAETRYVFGKYKGDFNPMHLDELRFTLGLGFNLDVLKEKKG